MKKLSVSFLSHNLIIHVDSSLCRKRISSERGLRWPSLRNGNRRFCTTFSRFNLLVAGELTFHTSLNLFSQRCVLLNSTRAFSFNFGKLCFFQIDLIYLKRNICRHTAQHMKNFPNPRFSLEILIKTFQLCKVTQRMSALWLPLLVAGFMKCFTFLTFNLHQHTIPLLFRRSSLRCITATGFANNDFAQQSPCLLN